MQARVTQDAAQQTPAIFRRSLNQQGYLRGMCEAVICPYNCSQRYGLLLGGAVVTPHLPVADEQSSFKDQFILSAIGDLDWNESPPSKPFGW